MTVLSDRYELGDVLGEGGMGRVVVAHDRVLQRDVAVKLLTRAPDASTKARFLREARDSARLRHPNAVTVFDTGEHEGQPFIVMELVRGQTLAELVAQDGPLDIEVATAITVGVLEALAAAHEAGLVHRDVKPANVILPEDGGVKLTDFGIAKAMNDATAGLTAAGTVLGTPTYLAPELVDGGTASPASDLYAVGCMLYLQLAGEPPFTADNPLAIAYAHLNRAVPRIEEHRPDVPDGLRRVLATALAKDPAERYADAPAMRADLLGEGPVGEGPVGSSGGATLPLTVALTPGTAGAGGFAAPPGAQGSVAGSAQQADADPTLAIHADTDDDPPGARPPWRAFVVGAVLLLAFVALALLWPFGDTGPADDPDTVDETEPTDLDEIDDEPEDDADPAPAEPGDDAPETEEPTAPDEPDEPDQPDQPDEPAPEPDDTPDPPEEPDPPADEGEPDEPGGGQGEPGGGQGPDGDGPPGQED